MGETYLCTVEGCDHVPFKTPQALASHIRNVHPDFIGEKASAREVPIVEDDFATLLRKFKIKADLATNIAENVSHTGGPRVFEDPELLLKRLARWSTDIAPGKRTLIIEQWFAEKGIDIPVEVKEKVGMTTEQMEKTEAETKAGGEIRYVWDTDTSQIRMAKEGERGGTLTQAKELKKMAEEDEKAGAESPFMQDGEGRWVLNPKAKVTGIELMAVQFMQQAQEKGEPTDPIIAMAQAAEKLKALRESLGVGAGATPTWMTDPAEFIKMIKDITGVEGEGGKPGWMSNPAEFIKMVREIGEGKGDDAVKSELTALRKSLEDMKDERHKQEMASLQGQIVQIQRNHEGQMKEILEKMEDLKKPPTGKSEMDIISDLVTGALGEAKGLRGDLKDVLRDKGLPPAKTTEQRETRKGKYRKALQDDQEIEELGRRLFMSS
ncbi:hypothetical protein LCGC14_0836620 [marine sediment metagenome]|uniref:Uncharacterized protein n=1 Tax=marine sediment metagenome TaxID=412755 RepID=A0A0F9PEC9_9ZZZZ